MIRIKPMLAYPVSDKPIPYENEQVFIQPKLTVYVVLYSEKNTAIKRG